MNIEALGRLVNDSNENPVKLGGVTSELSPMNGHVIVTYGVLAVAIFEEPQQYAEWIEQLWALTGNQYAQWDLIADTRHDSTSIGGYYRTPTEAAAARAEARVRANALTAAQAIKKGAQAA